MFLDGGKIWKNVIVVAKQVLLYGYDDDGDGEEVGDDYDCDDDYENDKDYLNENDYHGDNDYLHL